MAAREELIIAGATPEQIDAYASELADRVGKVENWPGAEHLAMGSMNTYRSLARRAASVIRPKGDQ